MEAPILFRFVVTLAVLPWFMVLAKRVRDAREYIPFAVVFYILCAAELATVIERVLGVEAMDVVQHGLYAAAGIVSAIGVFTVYRAVLERRGET